MEATLFSSQITLYSFLESKKASVKLQIQHLDQNAIANPATASALFSQYKLTAPVLLDSLEVLGLQESQTTVKTNPYDSPYLGFLGENIATAQWKEIFIKIPFITSGDSELLCYRPSKYSWGINSRHTSKMKDDGLYLSYQIASNSLPEYAKTVYLRDVEEVKTNVENVATEVNAYNDTLQGFISESLNKKKQQQQNNDEFLNALR